MMIMTIDSYMDLIIALIVTAWILIGVAAVNYDDITVINLITQWPEDFAPTIPWYNLPVAILLPFVAWPLALQKRKAYLELREKHRGQRG